MRFTGVHHGCAFGTGESNPTTTEQKYVLWIYGFLVFLIRRGGNFPRAQVADWPPLSASCASGTKRLAASLRAETLRSDYREADYGSLWWPESLKRCPCPSRSKKTSDGWRLCFPGRSRSPTCSRARRRWERSKRAN